MTVRRLVRSGPRTAFRRRSFKRSTAPRIRASTKSAVLAPSASCPLSMTWCCSALRFRAIRSKAIARRCDTNVVLGTRFAKKPIELKIPITIAGMSFGALGAHAKEAIGRAATAMGTSTHHRRRRHDARGAPVLQDAGLSSICLRATGSIPTTCASADAIEVVVGQGAKPGGGGMLLGQKITDRVAGHARSARWGSISAAPAGIPIGPGQTTSTIKIQELREITDWEKPIYVKIGGHPRHTMTWRSR